MLCNSPVRRLICVGSKRHPLTCGKQGAIVLGTAVAVVDAVAVADAEPVLGCKALSPACHSNPAGGVSFCAHRPTSEQFGPIEQPHRGISKPARALFGTPVKYL